MQRNIGIFSVSDTEIFKRQMLNWGNRFSICCFLDNHQYTDKYHSYEWLLAADAHNIFSPSENILQQLGTFVDKSEDWLFGHFNYDLKNEIETLHSGNSDFILFPDVFLFQPKTVIQTEGGIVRISSLNNDSKEIFEEIQSHTFDNPKEIKINWNVQPRISKEEYLQTIVKLKRHILRGDCYEINFCLEFFAEDVSINPLHIYERLTKISPNPFSCYYKCKDKYLFCASPERYLKKIDNTIISQPVKGTAKRNNQNQIEDEQIKKNLVESSKEKSENVMVVDLVRNDLNKICKEGTVHVGELYGIYTFPQVHQMISTVKGELQDEINFTEILKATFPMGSMTGAPKKRVMELIEQYEKSKRGIFSGAVGYITPQKNFDFNVVIRSIMYNAAKKYLNYQVGSGITFYSDPEKEFEECLLKAKAIEEVLK